MTHIFVRVDIIKINERKSINTYETLFYAFPAQSTGLIAERDSLIN